MGKPNSLLRFSAVSNGERSPHRRGNQQSTGRDGWRHRHVYSGEIARGEKHQRRRRIVEALAAASTWGSAFDTNAATTKRLQVVIENARRIPRRCVCGSRQGMRLRGARGGLVETPDDNSGSDRGTARRKFVQETADCDSASRRRYPGGDTRCATLLHVA